MEHRNHSPLASAASGSPPELLSPVVQRVHGLATEGFAGRSRFDSIDCASCGKSFHDFCIQRWADVSPNGGCPTCRADLSGSFGVVSRESENIEEMSEEEVAFFQDMEALGREVLFVSENEVLFRLIDLFLNPHMNEQLAEVCVAHIQSFSDYFKLQLAIALIERMTSHLLKLHAVKELVSSTQDPEREKARVLEEITRLDPQAHAEIIADLREWEIVERPFTWG